MAATDSLLGHCVRRAVLAVGREDVETGRRKATDRATRWDIIRAVGTATPKAGRVAAFVAEWSRIAGSPRLRPHS